MANDFLDSFNQVGEKLYIGDYFTSINYNALIQKNITHILVCGEELICRYPEEFTYRQFKIQDTSSTSIEQYFEEAYEFINEGKKRGSVLVHCAQARSRSASMVISYIMKKDQVNFKKALETLKKSHPQTSPNPGFIKQLKNYETRIELRKSSCMNSIF